ncbi:uncharacterized protein LOC113214253 [Frankliniella occidentalis]|uniref:Uncharacterized protein LOC113214253 n=1 Tax=Frankliniella occidentalis TaxID=133901 RepID=A0A9C6XT75_FRAOC|nr:uncharacterized protein LOC113214253 [Frankliniella occidentalis]
MPFLNVASAGRLRVFYHGEQPLSDIRSLRDCGLSHESEVHVMVAAESGRRATQGRLMPVRVRCFWEEVRDLVLALRARASVAELKEAARMELAANADHVLRAVRVGLPCGLADEWLLSEVVDEDSRVHLIVSTRQDRSKMRLRVQTLSNTELKLLVPRSARVEDLKRQIQAEEGFPPHLQRVLFAGEALEDHALLTDYGITSQSQLRVVLNLRGGGTEPLPEGAETVEAVAPAEVKGDGTRDKEEAGNEDATLAVAKVVAGERRAPPPTSRSNLKVLMISAAPLLVIEVALEAASAGAPAAPASKRIRIS